MSSVERANVRTDPRKAVASKARVENKVSELPKRPTIKPRWLLMVAIAAILTVVGWVFVKGIRTDNGTTVAIFRTAEFSFSYPSQWRVLSGPQDVPPIRIDTVVGNGEWHLNCEPAVGCGPDDVDVSDGRIVLKVFRRTGGPPQTCSNDIAADAYSGPNPVRITTSGAETKWEIPVPGSEFGQIGNVFFTLTTTSDSERAAANAALNSFRWISGYRADPACTSAPG